MSNGQQDDSVQFIAEGTESRIGTEACTLVTVLESKEREKGSDIDSESSLETEMEAGKRKRRWRRLFLVSERFFL
jgi:hypothetical protein